MERIAFLVESTTIPQTHSTVSESRSNGLSQTPKTNLETMEMGPEDRPPHFNLAIFADTFARNLSAFFDHLLALIYTLARYL